MHEANGRVFSSYKSECFLIKDKAFSVLNLESFCSTVGECISNTPSFALFLLFYVGCKHISACYAFLALIYTVAP